MEMTLPDDDIAWRYSLAIVLAPRLRFSTARGPPGTTTNPYACLRIIKLLFQIIASFCATYNNSKQYFVYTKTFIIIINMSTPVGITVPKMLRWFPLFLPPGL